MEPHAWCALRSMRGDIGLQALPHYCRHAGRSAPTSSTPPRPAEIPQDRPHRSRADARHCSASWRLFRAAVASRWPARIARRSPGRPATRRRPCRLVRLGDVLVSDFRANAIRGSGLERGASRSKATRRCPLTRANALGILFVTAGRSLQAPAARPRRLRGLLPLRRKSAIRIGGARHPRSARGRRQRAPAKPMRFLNAGLIRAMIVHARRKR